MSLPTARWVPSNNNSIYIMKTIIKREDLLEPLQKVIGAVERKQTLPILGHVLLQSRDGQASLTATDLEIELTAKLKPEYSEEDFSTTLPARKLLDIVKALPDQAEITLASEDGRIRITSGKSRFTLGSLQASDFPRIEDIQPHSQFSLPQKVLKKLIDKTAFAMALQDVRYYLNGMLMELGDKGIRLVATDGHRLALSEEPGSLGISSDRQIIIPRKGVLELGRLLNNDDTHAELLISQNHLRVQTPDLVFTSKLIDGKFPDYNRVIPEDGNLVMTVDRDVLKQSLHRISILSNEKYRGINLSLNENSLGIRAHNPDQEEAEEEITVDYHETPMEIGFNVTYLLDVLSVLDSDQVLVNLKDSNSSCIIRASDNDNFRYVVMPMRI